MLNTPTSGLLSIIKITSRPLPKNADYRTILQAFKEGSTMLASDHNM